MKLSVLFLRKALPESTVLYNQASESVRITEDTANIESLLNDQRECEVVIDSRIVGSGDIFCALQGSRVDGHDFLAQAIRNGARAVIVDQKHKEHAQAVVQELAAETMVVVVRDTMQALIELARNWRQRFTYPVVGITGSIGKTTTKEMVRTILDSAGKKTCITRGNQNSIIGLCLNVLRMRTEHEIAIFEFGISQKGEMELMGQIARPTLSLITNIRHAHLDGLGSIRDIAREKRAIFSHFEPNHIGIIAGDDPFLTNAYYHHPVVRFGRKVKNQIQARKIKVNTHDGIHFTTTFTFKIYNKKAEIMLPGNHKSLVEASLASASICYYLEIPFDDIVRGINSFKGCEQRFEFKTMKNNAGVIISDCYNANPDSTRAALQAFHQMKSKGPKIAVLGEMLEMGEKKIFWHRQIGRVLCRTMSMTTVILVGTLSKEIMVTAPLTMKFICVDTWQEAVKNLQEILDGKNDALVLAKASHGSGLSHLVDTLVQ